MLAEREARSGLEELNRELESRVEERTAELSRVNRELVEANRMKDVFLATLSHELRTPLTAILGWAHLLRAGRLDEQGTARAVSFAPSRPERIMCVQPRMGVSGVLSSCESVARNSSLARLTSCARA